MPRPAEKFVDTPSTLTESLRQLCRWSVLKTLQADAQESLQAGRPNWGYIELVEQAWDTRVSRASGDCIKP